MVPFEVSIVAISPPVGWYSGVYTVAPSEFVGDCSAVWPEEVVAADVSAGCVGADSGEPHPASSTAVHVAQTSNATEVRREPDFTEPTTSHA